ncbi:D-alanyl-D-alanine carboxypeptidase [Candidatus Falkowbacteria bacterium]|nr:D-alanyl-D-alanine carboxypeptidase [Candidatus Falkowbacteria bacterium]
MPYVEKRHVDDFVHWSSEQLFGRTVLALTGNSLHNVRLSQGNGLPAAAARPPMFIGASSTEEITSASSAVVIDLASEGVLYAKNADQPGPIASITKLVTAMVFLDHNPGWEKVYKMKASDRREGGKIYLFEGERVRVRDLFHLSLVASGNSETVALANSTGLTEQEFVAAMNEKMRDLGLEHSVFYDEVGLNDLNSSTAKEVALMAKTALGQKDIMDATLTEASQIKTLGGRVVKFESTDDLLARDLTGGLSLLGGKTGHTNSAGYCFVGKFANQDRKMVISVVLGADSDASRFTETHNLVGWTYANYGW